MGTKCAVILGKGQLPETTDGFIIDKTAFPTNVERGCKEVLQNILDEADKLLNKHSVSTNELIGIGISCGGRQIFCNIIRIRFPLGLGDKFCHLR